VFGCLNRARNWDYWARWKAARARLPFGIWVEHRFDVDHRGAVERFELADQDPQTLDGEDLGPVQADRVTVRLAENTRQPPACGVEPVLTPSMPRWPRP
jgi:hypothetical protein